MVGCSQDRPSMDRPAADGQYHYDNYDLGFSLTLPAEFIYYQTERHDQTDYTDIEFFVPTSDRTYAQEVEGYAKPITLRVFKKSSWQEAQSDASQAAFEKIGQSFNKIYAIKFWDKAPADWQKVWSQIMIEKIKQGFKY